MPRLTPLTPAELQAKAQTYGGEAVTKLASTMRSPKATPAVRLTAARAILERGYGRPASLREDEEGLLTVIVENYGDDDEAENAEA